MPCHFNLRGLPSFNMKKELSTLRILKIQKFLESLREQNWSFLMMMTMKLSSQVLEDQIKSWILTYQRVQSLMNYTFQFVKTLMFHLTAKRKNSNQERLNLLQVFPFLLCLLSEKNKTVLVAVREARKDPHHKFLHAIISLALQMNETMTWKLCILKSEPLSLVATEEGQSPSSTLCLFYE